MEVDHCGERVLLPAECNERSREQYDRFVALVDRTLVVAHEDYTVPAWSKYTVKARLPHMCADRHVEILNLDRTDSRFYVTKMGMSIREGVYAPDDEGCVVVECINSLSRPLQISEGLPLACYRLQPETCPLRSELTAEEIVEKLTVHGDTPEEEQQRRQELISMLKERRERVAYFSMTRTGRASGPEVHLKPTEEFLQSGRPPPNVRGRKPHDPEAQAAVDKYREAMVRDGQLVPSSSPFGAAVVAVRKAGGKGWRMALDFRETNKILAKQHYPLPTVEECLNALGKAKVFSCWDLINAFWQIPLHPSEQRFIVLSCGDPTAPPAISHMLALHKDHGGHPSVGR